MFIINILLYLLGFGIEILFFGLCALLLLGIKASDGLPKLKQHVTETFKYKEHPYRALLSDFWAATHKYILICFLISLPFLSRYIHDVTDIDNIDAPYTETEMKMNKNADHLYYSLEDRYGYHNKCLDFMEEHDKLFRFFNYPMHSLRQSRRMSRRFDHIFDVQWVEYRTTVKTAVRYAPSPDGKIEEILEPGESVTGEIVDGWLWFNYKEKDYYICENDVELVQKETRTAADGKKEFNTLTNFFLDFKMDKDMNSLLLVLGIFLFFVLQYIFIPKDSTRNEINQSRIKPLLYFLMIGMTALESLLILDNYSLIGMITDLDLWFFFKLILFLLYIFAVSIHLMLYIYLSLYAGYRYYKFIKLRWWIAGILLLVIAGFGGRYYDIALIFLIGSQLISAVLHGIALFKDGNRFEAFIYPIVYMAMSLVTDYILLDLLNFILFAIIA